MRLVMGGKGQTRDGSDDGGEDGGEAGGHRGKIVRIMNERGSEGTLGGGNKAG